MLYKNFYLYVLVFVIGSLKGVVVATCYDRSLNYKEYDGIYDSESDIDDSNVVYAIYFPTKDLEENMICNSLQKIFCKQKEQGVSSLELLMLECIAKRKRFWSIGVVALKKTNDDSVYLVESEFYKQPAIFQRCIDICFDKKGINQDSVKFDLGGCMMRPEDLDQGNNFRFFGIISCLSTLAFF